MSFFQSQVNPGKSGTARRKKAGFGAEGPFPLQDSSKTQAKKRRKTGKVHIAIPPLTC